MCEGGLEASFLHHVAPHLTQLNPNLHSDTDIFELVHGFFAFYGNTNFSERRLNPIKGEMEAKTTTWDKTAALDIINPLGKFIGIIQNFLVNHCKNCTWYTYLLLNPMFFIYLNPSFVGVALLKIGMNQIYVGYPTVPNFRQPIQITLCERDILNFLLNINN